MQKLQPTTAVFAPLRHGRQLKELAILHLAQGPGKIKSREVELGSHSDLDSQLLLQLFLNSCFSDIVFVILLRRAVETAVSEAHRLLGSGGIPTSLRLFSVAVPA